MAETDIIQNMIRQLGQSQEERRAGELDPLFAQVDERTMADQLLFARRLAEQLTYYQTGSGVADGSWADFFPSDEAGVKRLLEDNSGETPPHLALFLAFLELYQIPRELINRITGEHLTFHYRRLLRLAPKGAVGDRAHLLLELKKNAAPLKITPEHLFKAGKDALGKELLYGPIRSTIINSSRIDSLRSLFVDRRGHGTIRCAPIANSADGLGKLLDETAPRWSGFGHQALPLAEVGFALGSPLLRLQEGLRQVTVTLGISNLSTTLLTSTEIEQAWDVHLTGAKGWLGPFSLSSASHTAGTLQFSFTVPLREGAVVDFDPTVHLGCHYAPGMPVLQLHLRQAGMAAGYLDFSTIIVNSARITVDVSQITTLALESDHGRLDPSKAFLPFGPNPAALSRFRVNYAEAFAKDLTRVRLDVQWKGLPPDLGAYYHGYYEKEIDGSAFTAAVELMDHDGQHSLANDEPLFVEREATGAATVSAEKRTKGTVRKESSPSSELRTFSFRVDQRKRPQQAGAAMQQRALHATGSAWARQEAGRRALVNSLLTGDLPALAGRAETGLCFRLNRDLLHDRYRQLLPQKLTELAKIDKGSAKVGNVSLAEPYTPCIQSISFAYQASSDLVQISSNKEQDFANLDLLFYHLAYFGQYREHGFQRSRFGLASPVPLLPLYENSGELLIGFSGLAVGDSVSVLFQVAEGSSDPDLAQERLSWHVLGNNYWHRLGSSAVLLDTINNLLASGTITFVIPDVATSDNSILPSDRIWIKAAVAGRVEAFCQLLQVAANAVEVAFIDQGNDLAHLASSLEQGRIVVPRQGIAALKSVKQPYASFGGRAGEDDAAFHTRVAERLRHKNRCITPWDYERIVLEAFPRLHKVKCIPHARPGCWLSPGHLLLVVIPDLKNKNAFDPLQPKVDAATLSRISDHIRTRCNSQVTAHVHNPRYEAVQFAFKVRFVDGFEPNFFERELRGALLRFLSPWAFTSDRDISFGGTIYRSVLLDMIEELEYVEYVTDFRMCRLTGDDAGQDQSELRPTTPDAILVAARAEQHRITVIYEQD